MAVRSRDNHPTPRHGHYSASQDAFRCGFAMPLPDFVTTLTVTDRFSGLLIELVADLERSQVRDELHRLQGLYPPSVGYAITATVKERTA